jgi:hypothetical protein
MNLLALLDRRSKEILDPTGEKDHGLEQSISEFRL